MTKWTTFPLLIIILPSLLIAPVSGIPLSTRRLIRKHNGKIYSGPNLGVASLQPTGERDAFMSKVMSLMLTLVTRSFVGAFNPFKPSEVIVKVAASNNINTLLGRWTSFVVNIGPDAGLISPLYSLKVTGRQLDVGVIPARLLILLTSLATGNMYVLLLNLFISAKELDSPPRPCCIEWVLCLSSQNLNGFILKPFMQSVLDTLMKNSVLTSALLARETTLDTSKNEIAEHLKFNLNSVKAKNGGVEFDSTATYKQNVNSVEEMNLNFKLKTKVECDNIGGNGFMFTEPGIKTDFTEVIESTLAQVRSPIGKSILKKLVPKNPITYMPVGAAVIFSLPCRVLSACVNDKDKVEIIGRIELNKPKPIIEGMFDALNKLILPTLPTSSSR